MWLVFFEALVVLLEWVAGCMFADIEVTNMISSVHMVMIAVVTCMVACFGDLSWYSSGVVAVMTTILASWHRYVLR